MENAEILSNPIFLCFLAKNAGSRYLSQVWFRMQVYHLSVSSWLSSGVDLVKFTQIFLVL